MRFSFSLVPSSPLSTFGDTIAKAEEWGYDLAWVPDQGFMYDPFVALSYLMTRTKAISLGVGITNPFQRHPMQIARAAVALDDLRPGSFVLGLGAGEKRRIRDRVGAPVGPFIPTISDTMQTLRALFAGEKVSISNGVFELDDVGLEIKKPTSVPIFLATTHPDAFRAAGAYADGVIVGDVAEPSVMAQIIEWIDEGARSNGRTKAGVAVVAWCATIVADNRAAAIEHLRRPVIGSAINGMNRVTRDLMGVDQADFPQIRAAKFDASLSLPEDSIPDDMVDRFAIAGPPDYCAERICALRDVGVDTMGFRMPVALTGLYDFETNLRRLIHDVVPLVQG
ncbi:MAG: LLM class flavin-dependent oxidoreductase [Alphaproteobacteria bacterium]|jgi:5,10-methylenetetrahydromethanopterin reductase